MAKRQKLIKQLRAVAESFHGAGSALVCQAAELPAEVQELLQIPGGDFVQVEDLAGLLLGIADKLET